MFACTSLGSSVSVSQFTIPELEKGTSDHLSGPDALHRLPHLTLTKKLFMPLRDKKAGLDWLSHCSD